ncbi:ABC transporter permease subunit [Modestobacter sp. I12A-02628]|uniref:Carbohydrate ABC transporter permease n=1 Tax=Goekera deserti TaxID=2497753 RepID=A0A7K3WBG2_9ACTN|nr:carbohydrate ABC transporter permease [Goekera deserti]MPQ97480.1 ABC transporter permease subunit [Goekera deserti]NDI47919.1 ABC transporter permease subunit [Goekera deserti]NEL53667.1 carbohydrate ABC transporter permease [Goekera deserti]
MTAVLTPATADQPPPRPRPLSRTNLVATITTGYVPLVLATLVVVLPLVWMVLASFKTSSELLTQRLDVLPSSFAPTNYTTAADRVPFGRLFLNSLVVTAVGSAIKVVLAIMTAYALVFVRFPFKKVVFGLVLATLMVPPQVSVVPNYVLIVGLGGANTYWGIILPGLATGFGTFLLRQQFMSLPASIIEAAELDGAGHWRRMTQIVVPISTPAIATVALVNIVFEWNEYLWPLVIVTDPDMMTLPVGLTLLTNSENGADSYGILMAATVMVVLPVLLVFAAFQRYIVAGLTQGAVKD